MDENSSGDELSVSPPFDDRTRRAFFSATATLGTVAIAGCGAEAPDPVPGNETGDGSPIGTTVGPGATDEPTEEFTETEADTETETETDTEMPEPTNSDVAVVNYALTLEHLEYAFYRDGLEEFGDEEFRTADALSNVDDTLREDVPERLRTIRDHEEAHVDALSGTVEALQQSGRSENVTPVQEGEYDFGYENPSEFLAVARDLENTGVAAYAGAAPIIKSNDVLAAAAGIHSVEARHAGLLNHVNGESPFPTAFDEAMSVNEVLSAIGGLVTSDVDRSAYPRQSQGGGRGGDGQGQGGRGRDPQQLDRRKDDDTSDVDVLNYALGLEHLEYAFYRDGLEQFDDQRLENADQVIEFSQDFRAAIPDHLAAIRDHERQHVEALSGAVDSVGDMETPVEEASYDFGYDSAGEFLEIAATLENTGVAAYKGAVTTVSADAVLNPALSIHSVEARHAGYLNLLNGQSPFPQTVDEPMSMSEVQAAIEPFVQEDDPTPTVGELNPPSARSHLRQL
jgi:rubrerythrin